MDDKYLWLEEVLDEKSLEWARAENKKTIDFYKANPEFDKTVSQIQQILESKDKIPFADFINNGFVYNTWTDDKNIQGLVRRSPIASYITGNANWELILDLDEQSVIDSQKWVLKHFDVSPNHQRALVYLSPGGTDAHIVRELDLVTKSFVVDGFELPVSKGSAEWLSDDELLIIRDFGPETVTSSGYPRTVRKWKRGALLDSAPTVYEIPKEDVFVYSVFYHGEGKTTGFLQRRIDFYSGELFKIEGSQFKLIPLAKKFDILGFNNDILFVNLREDWKSYSAGDVLAYDIAKDVFELVFSPGSHSSVYSGGMIKDGLILILDKDVKGSLLYLSKKDNKWVNEIIEMPKNGSIDMLTTDNDTNDFFVTFDSFNTPVSYFYGQKNKILSTVRKQPGFFDYENVEVEQHFSTSNDGTKVPYFLVYKKGMKFNGANPTILYGYGGFEISLKAHFNNILGSQWLDKGGVYALANIRGGGEYGPAWHQAALKDKRDRAYEDFFSIAEDLFRRDVTRPEHLGAMGGSNGGLLMGVCFTQRPDLFKAINCGVPLLDMRRYHKLLAGHSWVAEYGNPDDEKDGRYIRALSPYHRINEEQKNYPVMFLNTSTKDDRVHPGHARKFAAKLKEYGHEYYYHENIDGGHAGASNMKELAFMKALDYAFFWKFLK